MSNQRLQVILCEPRIRIPRYIGTPISGGSMSSFYEQHGVEEYYIYEPVGGASPSENRIDFTGWIRNDERFDAISEGEGSIKDDLTNWISPRLGIEFKMQPDTLVIYHPDGRPFLSFVELDLRRQQAEQATEQANQRADEAERRAELLAAKLRELGIDPTSL